MKFPALAPNSSFADAPSGKGQVVPARTPDRKFGALPRPFHLHGSAGEPSAHADVVASQLMQRSLDDADQDDFETWDADPPYDVMRAFIAETVGLDVDDDSDDEDVDEASVAANVAGYTLPLGMSNRSRKQEPPWKSYARAWGRARPVS